MQKNSFRGLPNSGLRQFQGLAVVAQALMGLTQVKGTAVIRLELVKGFKMGQGGSILSPALQQKRQIIVVFGLSWIEAEGVAVVLLGLFMLALLFRQQSEPIPDVRVLGVGADQTLKQIFCDPWLAVKELVIGLLEVALGIV